MLQNDPVRLPPFHFDADPDPASQKLCWSMRIRARIRNTAPKLYLFTLCLQFYLLFILCCVWYWCSCLLVRWAGVETMQSEQGENLPLSGAGWRLRGSQLLIRLFLVPLQAVHLQVQPIQRGEYIFFFSGLRLFPAVYLLLSWRLSCFFFSQPEVTPSFLHANNLVLIMFSSKAEVIPSFLSAKKLVLIMFFF